MIDVKADRHPERHADRADHAVVGKIIDEALRGKL
jgi:hypothetical protein